MSGLIYVKGLLASSKLILQAEGTTRSERNETEKHRISDKVEREPASRNA